VVGRHGGGDDHGPGVGQVRRIVTAVDGHPQGGEVGRAGGIGVAPAHRDTSAAGDQRQGAHPRAGDADEMHRPSISGGKQVHVGFGNVSSCCRF
jgi:hypothetical protein